MSTASNATRFTALFDNSILSRLERLRLNSLRRLTVRSRGEHQTGKGGTSTEFADYRDYVPGDDVKNVDWNIFSRLNRPYIKLYRHEEEMHVVLLIDASTSMQFEGKLQLAKQLAGACGLMGLMNSERVSVYACHHLGKSPELLPPCTGRVSLRRLFRFIEEIQAGGDTPLEAAVDVLLRQHRGRGVVVLLSDFLTLGDINPALNSLFSAGLEIHAVQILSEPELHPELTGDIRLVDSETGETLDISGAAELFNIYQDQLAWQEMQLTADCQKRSGRFMRVSTSTPLDSILFDAFRRKGWIR
ncbi:MAG: DUF58 domain-containing protein [Planctomycetota bacterium]